MSKKIAILGIGQAGVRIVSELHGTKQAENFSLFAIDTDKNTLEESVLEQNSKILLGENWRYGRGCGGLVLAGNRAFASGRQELDKLLDGFEIVFFVGGLGRGTASGSIQILSSIINRKKLPAIFVLTQPFSMEGPAKIRVAENLLKNEVHDAAEVAIVIPNDLLFSKLDPNCNLMEAFNLSNIEIAKVVLSLGLIFQGGNILAANHTDFTEVFNRKHFSAIGIGVATGRDGVENRCNLVIERMLMSPLLGGVNHINDADAVVVSLVTGDNFSASDSKYILDKVISFANKDSKVIVNVSTDSSFQDSILLSAIAVKYDENILDSELLASPNAGSAIKKKSVGTSVNQQTFDFGTDLNDRGIMENTVKTYYNKENLDIPTFLRKNLKIQP